MLDNASFDGNSVRADTPLQAHAKQRHTFDEVMAAAIRDGDNPAVVAKALVAQRPTPEPRLRYPARPADGTRQHAAPRRSRPGV